MGLGRLPGKAQIGSYQVDLGEGWRGAVYEKSGIMQLTLDGAAAIEQVTDILDGLGMRNLKPHPDVPDTDWQAWLEALPEMELRIICPRCGDGQLVRRHGKHGEFWGCSEFSLSGCRHTQSMVQNE